MADNIVPEKPLNRTEKYLAIIGGEDYEIPKPLNRIEQYLANIAENGGGGGGAGLPPVTAADNGKVLGVVNGAWAADSRGYAIESTETVCVPQQSVTTAEQEGLISGNLTDIESLPKSGDTAIVTFDGVDYEVIVTEYDGTAMLGDVTEYVPDFTRYPFVINIIDLYGGVVVTETAGTYTVKVTKVTKAATVDDDFVEAVKTADAIGEFHINFTYDLDLAVYGCDKTFAETATAFNNGQKIVAHYNDEPLLCQKLNTEADYFEFVFVSGISSGSIGVDMFGFAIDDTVTVGTGAISLGGVS